MLEVPLSELEAEQEEVDPESRDKVEEEMGQQVLGRRLELDVSCGKCPKATQDVISFNGLTGRGSLQLFGWIFGFQLFGQH